MEEDPAVFTEKLDKPGYLSFSSHGITEPDHKVLTGWMTEEGTVIVSEDSVTGYYVTESMDLYPVWTEAYVITLHTDEGSFVDAEEDGTVKMKVKAGDPYSFYRPEMVMPEGRTLLGWKDSSGFLAIDFSSGCNTPTADMDLYSVWADAAVLSFHVDRRAIIECSSFGGGYGFPASDEPYQVAVAVGAPYNNEYVAAYDETGRENLGWADESGNIVYSRTVEFVPAEDTDLYAVWDITHTLMLDGNGGMFGDASFALFALPEGSTIDSLIMPNRTGYIQVGWSTSADGEAEIATDDIMSYEVTKDETLYAVWAEAVSITFHTDTVYLITIPENGLMLRKKVRHSRIIRTLLMRAV